MTKGEVIEMLIRIRDEHYRDLSNEDEALILACNYMEHDGDESLFGGDENVGEA